MERFRRFMKWIFVPITIMMVPHSNGKSFGFRVPVVGVFLSVLMFLVGTSYVCAVSIRTIEYHNMKARLQEADTHYQEIRATLDSLKYFEGEFRKLFELKTKKDVLKAANFTDSGSIDMKSLKEQIDRAMESASDIKGYIMKQKDLYLATPAGWPVNGHISSGYGFREHPLGGDTRFHSGIDLSVPVGSPVRATADGIVSFSGWAAGSGNTIVIEHGHGFSTAFGHNSRNLVKVGRHVKRGEEIAVSGSTGISTGPHLHYEIWKNGQHVDPSKYGGRG